MGTSSGVNFQQQSMQKIPFAGLQNSVTILNSDSTALSIVKEPTSNSDQIQESHAESDSSQETWPIETKQLERHLTENQNEDSEQSKVCRVSSSNKISLQDVASGRIEVIHDRMLLQQESALEELKNELRFILEGAGGFHNREEILLLQKLVHSRTDLTDKTLMTAHRVQLQILVAINTGIQAFLHPSVAHSKTCLIEVFLYKRCRNIACQSSLPANNCTCELCTKRKGFCHLCMCQICHKFDFEMNTCQWIGCDVCGHWTHAECAIHCGLICTGPSSKNYVRAKETLSKCPACNSTSELFGWVKDVFEHCASSWNRDGLMRELDIVSMIFRASDDSRGRKLFRKCEDLIENMRKGVPESMACQEMLLFFQELERDLVQNSENEEGERLIAPLEACNRIAEVVHEAIMKMELVADEKKQMSKKARLSLEDCDHELEEKSRQVNELKMEMQRKKKQVNELEAIVRLKQAEADMFQLKANEARQEAERLQGIALSRSDKSEDDYANMYLKLRLSEAEAEKQYLFEKMKLEESSQIFQKSQSKSSMLWEIQNLLKDVYNVSSQSDGPAK